MTFSFMYCEDFKKVDVCPRSYLDTHVWFGELFITPYIFWFHGSHWSLLLVNMLPICSIFSNSTSLLQGRRSQEVI